MAARGTIQKNNGYVIAYGKIKGINSNGSQGKLAFWQIMKMKTKLFLILWERGSNGVCAIREYGGGYDSCGENFSLYITIIWAMKMAIKYILWGRTVFSGLQSV